MVARASSRPGSRDPRSSKATRSDSNALGRPGSNSFRRKSLHCTRNGRPVPASTRRCLNSVPSGLRCTKPEMIPPFCGTCAVPSKALRRPKTPPPRISSSERWTTQTPKRAYRPRSAKTNPSCTWTRYRRFRKVSATASAESGLERRERVVLGIDEGPRDHGEEEEQEVRERQPQRAEEPPDLLDDEVALLLGERGELGDFADGVRRRARRHQLCCGAHG